MKITEISKSDYLINDKKLDGNLFYIPYTTNVLCNYSNNNEYISIEEELKRFVEARVKEKIFRKKIKNYNNMYRNKKLSLTKLFLLR